MLKKQSRASFYLYLYQQLLLSRFTPIWTFEESFLIYHTNKDTAKKHLFVKKKKTFLYIRNLISIANNFQINAAFTGRLAKQEPFLLFSPNLLKQCFVYNYYHSKPLTTIMQPSSTILMLTQAQTWRQEWFNIYFQTLIMTRVSCTKFHINFLENIYQASSKISQDKILSMLLE